MPDVGDDGEGGPLEGEAEGGSVGGNGDVECSCSLALFLKQKLSALGVVHVQVGDIPLRSKVLAGQHRQHSSVLLGQRASGQNHPGAELC